MLSTKLMERIADNHGLDPVAMRLSAENLATPQNHKIWGLRDGQCDVIATMHRRGDLQAVVNLAVDHYRKINSL